MLRLPSAGVYKLFFTLRRGDRLLVGHPGPRRAAPLDPRRTCHHFIALSVTSADQAPSGSLEITGSEPPDISVSTVR